MKILILNASPRSYATKSIIKAGEKRGHEMTVLDPSYLYLLISDRVQGYDAIFDSYPAMDKEKPERLKAKDYDCVISRIGRNLSYGLSVLEHFSGNLGLFSTQTPYGISIAANKLLSGQKISQAKIRTPKTLYADKLIHIAWALDQIGGLPAIAKGLTGSQGKSVLPLIDPYQTNVYLKNYYQQKSRKDNLLLQKFIDAGGKDIRAIVIDNQVVTAMERTAKPGELRANISQGGSGKKIELSDEDKTLCIRASNACGLSVSGVDLIKNPDGVSYIVEVNGNYGYHIEKITGDDISTPLIKYCERNYKSGNKSNMKSDAVALGFNVESHIYPQFSKILDRPVLSGFDRFGYYAAVTKDEFTKHGKSLVGVRVKVIDTNGK